MTWQAQRETVELVNRVLTDVASRIVAECNHSDAGMQYPCCEPCWDRSRMVLSYKTTSEGTHEQ